MKKIISIVLALVMMMAVTVPAFAETTYQSVSQEGTPTADVVTSTKDINGNDAYSYTVTFPAIITVAWNDKTAQPATYSVESQLLIGDSLKVSVAYDTDTDETNNGIMEADGTDETLTYILEGGNEVTFAEVNEAGTTAPGVKNGTNATVKIEDFSGVPVAAYEGKVTYSVTYVPKP